MGFGGESRVVRGLFSPPNGPWQGISEFKFTSMTTKKQLKHGCPASGWPFSLFKARYLREKCRLVLQRERNPIPQIRMSDSSRLSDIHLCFRTALIRFFPFIGHPPRLSDCACPILPIYRTSSSINEKKVGFPENANMAVLLHVC